MVLPKFVENVFTCVKGYEVRVSCVVFCLVETKLIYRVTCMHALSLIKLKPSDKL